MRTRKVVALCLLLGLVFVSSAEIAELACPEGRADGGCGECDILTGNEAEGDCDHCIACVVSHGHLVSMMPAPLAALGIAPQQSLLGRPVLIPEKPFGREFFHPPLV